MFGRTLLIATILTSAEGAAPAAESNKCTAECAIIEGAQRECHTGGRCGAGKDLDLENWLVDFLAREDCTVNDINRARAVVEMHEKCLSGVFRAHGTWCSTNAFMAAADYIGRLRTVKKLLALQDSNPHADSRDSPIVKPAIVIHRSKGDVLADLKPIMGRSTTCLRKERLRLIEQDERLVLGLMDECLWPQLSSSMGQMELKAIRRAALRKAMIDDAEGEALFILFKSEDRGK